MIIHSAFCERKKTHTYSKEEWEVSKFWKRGVCDRYSEVFIKQEVSKPSGNYGLHMLPMISWLSTDSLTEFYLWISSSWRTANKSYLEEINTLWAWTVVTLKHFCDPCILALHQLRGFDFTPKVGGYKIDVIE